MKKLFLIIALFSFNLFSQDNIINNDVLLDSEDGCEMSEEEASKVNIAIMKMLVDVQEAQKAQEDKIQEICKEVCQKVNAEVKKEKLDRELKVTLFMLGFGGLCYLAAHLLSK